MADANDSAAILAQVNQDLKNLGYISQETTQRMKASEKAAKDFETKMALGGKAVSALADAGMAAASAMYQGEKGAAAFNKSIGSMSEAAMAAGAVLTMMIPGGPIIKALFAGMTLAVGAVAKYTQAANEMSDKLYTTFQKMSKSGAAASDGLRGIYGDMQKLGLGIQDLDGYVEMINASSRDLALFGGSVFEGRKAFADMGAAMKPFREQLYNAGLSQEQINAGAMSYIKLQARLGYSQSQTTKQLADGAKKYLIEQDALTKLTGQAREDTERQRQEALQEEQFRAKLRQMELEGDAAGAERLRKYNDLMTAINPELGKGIRALATGNVVAAEAQQLLLTSSGQAAEDLQKVMDGTLPLAAAADSTAKAIGKFSDEVGVNLGVLKANNGVFMDLAATQDIRIAQEKGFEKTLAKIEEEKIKQGVEGGKAADKLQQAQTDLRLKQLDAMQAAQDFVAKGMLPATYAAIKMAGAVDNTVSAINKLVDTILKLVDDITNSSVVKYLTGANDRDKTSEEKEAQQRVEAAKVAYEKAFAGVGMFDPKRFRIGSSKEQDAADIELSTAQREDDRTRAKMNEKYGTTKQSAAAAGMPGTSTTAAPAGAPGRGMTAQDLASAGLQIRGTGDVQAPGEEVSSNLIELAKKIQKSVPGFEYFSGFNDKYHNNESESSLHTKGMAADFVLGRKPSKEEGQEIVSLLKSLGASKARDEYNNPSAKATAGHFHVEIAKMAEGGIIKARPGGTVVQAAEAGRDEAYIPLTRGHVPVKIDTRALIDSMPKMEIDEKVTEKLGKSFKDSFGEDFQNNISRLTKILDGMQAQENLDIQRRMLDVLSDIKNSQNNTADNTSRMVAMASN